VGLNPTGATKIGEVVDSGLKPVNVKISGVQIPLSPKIGSLITAACNPVLKTVSAFGYGDRHLRLP
jgi:hypothetical protein